MQAAIRHRFAVATAALALLALATPASAADAACTMKFDLKGWSAFYKTATGTGKVTCSNGQSATVKLTVNGGGFTFGSSEFMGTGRFAYARGIDEVLGGYFRIAAEGGPAGAYVYRKGPVRLAVSGTGRGFTLGFDFGNLTISK
jgi:hypothetical protein